MVNINKNNSKRDSIGIYANGHNRFFSTRQYMCKERDAVKVVKQNLPEKVSCNLLENFEYVLVS